MSSLGCRHGVKKKKCRFAALGTRTLQFCPSSAQALPVTLGGVPRSGTSFLNYQYPESGVEAERGPQTPGDATRSVLAVPHPWTGVTAHLRTGSATGSLGAVRPWFPRPGNPRLCPALAPCDPLLGRDLAIILPSAEKRSVYPSFSPWSFLFQGIPGPATLERFPPWLCLQTPFLPSGDFPCTPSSPPRGVSIHASPFFLKLSRLFHPPVLCRAPKDPHLQSERKASPTSATGFWGPLSPPR